MSTATAPSADLSARTRTTFVDLVRAELRKLNVSRTFLVLTLLALTLVIVAILFVQRFGTGPVVYADALATLSLLLWVIAPLLSAQIACSDFATGEMQTWFVLEPRRWRVVLAKLACALLVNAAVIAAAFALAALLTFAGGVVTGRGSDFTTDLRDAVLLGMPVIAVGALMGVAWGVLLQRFGLTSLLIIGQAVVLNIAVMFIPDWLGPYISSASILGMFHGENTVAEGVASTFIWCVAPFLGGLHRVSRQHI